MERKYKHRPEKKYYPINHNIRVPQLRVLNDKGQQKGIMSTDQALRLAQQEQVDLVLVAAQAKPPVARLIDFKKFLYQIEKKEKNAKKGVKKSTTKDINLSLFIGEQDFDRFCQKAKEFLQEGHQVRVKLFLKGREIGKKQMAFDLVSKFIQRTEIAAMAVEPKLQGRSILAVLNKSKESQNTDHEKQTKNTQRGNKKI